LADPALTAPSTVVLDGGPLRWDDYEAVVYGGAEVAVGGGDAIERHRAALERQARAGERIYAVNTGYGADAGRVVPIEAAERIQRNTLRSHAVGTGDPAGEAIVRGAMLIKAQAYARGPAAVRREIVDGLLALLNQRIHPVVPLQGSQSASGDLIPNAHIGLALMGEGDVTIDGRRVPAAQAPIAPLRPAMKEGVAVTNDCALAAALGVDLVRAAMHLIDRTEDVAAMTLQALLGHPDAFDERLVAARPHRGALASAARMRSLLHGSVLLRGAQRVHDPYCLRCLPQVHGAVRDALGYARGALEIEISSVGDNPLVFADDGAILSGGNFHGEPLAIPFDTVGIALAELAALSQLRTRQLVGAGSDTGLPANLTRRPDGFGLLMLNTSAAALVSEARTRARPASLESIGVDAVEDHVSMAAVAARGALAVLDLARRVVAIELACAAQALELRGLDGAAAPAVALHAATRAHVGFLDEDRPLATDELTVLL